MDARSKRREATRRQLEQQLRERQAREARRRRTTLVASVVGTVAVIALVIVLVVVFTGGSSNTKKTASQPSSSAPTSSSAPLAAPAACTTLTGKASVTFDGVTVGGATDLSHQPKVTSTSAADPTALECADLVVGKGAPATTASTVTVQYTGVLYKDGTKFDSSYDHGSTGASFGLTPGQVIDGFSQGIAGTGKVAPMHVGGRRIIIMPAQLAYGASGNSGVPPNAPLVFVVDLLKV